MHKGNEGSGWIESLRSRFSAFIEAVPNSIRGHLNSEELIRAVIVALTSGGGVFGLLNAIAYRAGEIFPSPADAALAVAVFSLITESRRRLDHGVDPPRLPTRNRAA